MPILLASAPVPTTLTALKASFLARLGKRHAHDPRRIRSTLKPLECFLQVTNQELDAALPKSELLRILEAFLGALYSDRLVGTEYIARYQTANSALKLFALHGVKSSLVATTVKPTGKLLRLAEQFDHQELNQDAVQRWAGWPMSNINGTKLWLKLEPLVDTLGAAFCRDFYDNCSAYFSSGRATRIPAMSSLLRYMGTLQNLNAPLLLSPKFVKSFWRGFAVFFFEEQDSQGVRIETSMATWRNGFCRFVKECL
ncbi:hypothetical protein [Pseudoxanthomonas mexicana]